MKIQEAGRAGLLAGIKGLENAGKAPKEDRNNWQPRVGMAWDIRADGRDVVRAGRGIYMDMAHTNSNGLFAAFDAQGRFGTVLEVTNPNGIRNPDGSFYRIGQPVSNIASQNDAFRQRRTGSPDTRGTTRRIQTAGWPRSKRTETVKPGTAVVAPGARR